MPILKRALLSSSFLFLPFALCAALPPCSIHPPKGASQDELFRLSKISEHEARGIALSTVKADAAPIVKSAELEVEQGCLVWSCDIKVPGHSGAHEVFIDAGNGQVLSRSHETEKQEQAEQKEDVQGQPK